MLKLSSIFIFLTLLCFQMSAQWQANGTAIYNTNSGNVGIGTDNPSHKLTILNGFVESKLSNLPGQGSGLAGFALTSTKTQWVSYIAAPDGGWGVGPQNYEIWEYPNDVAGGDCCRRRFVIENSYGTSSAGLFYVNSRGHLGIGLAPTATIDLVRGSATGGTACFRGTNRNSHFNYNSSEETYIRGGKPTSNVILNDDGGNVLIGKTSQTETGTRYKLDVEGPIRAHEIVVNTTGADFVFEPTYKLRTLSELETFIHTNKHLPDIAPAKEMQENGVSAGEMQAKLLQKVEELTLYVIEKDKEIAEQKRVYIEQQKVNQEQGRVLLELKNEIESLKLKIN